MNIEEYLVLRIYFPLGQLDQKEGIEKEIDSLRAKNCFVIEQTKTEGDLRVEDVAETITKAKGRLKAKREKQHKEDLKKQLWAELETKEDAEIEDIIVQLR